VCRTLYLAQVVRMILSIGKFRILLAMALATMALATIGLTAGVRSSRAEGAWADTRIAEPFVCRADFSLTQADQLLEELAQLQVDLTRRLGIRPAREPIELYLFANEAAYRRFLKEQLPEVPYRRALYVKDGGPGRVFAYRSRQFEADVRHECTHALLHAVLPVVPLWLDEGLAKYFEVAPGRRAFDNPYLGGLRWSLYFGKVPSLSRLEKLGEINSMGHAEYRDAWAWVHFLLHGSPEARQELVGFLADIQARTPPDLMSQRLARRIPDLSKRFHAHFRHWKR